MAAKLYDEVQQRINLFMPPDLIETAKREAKVKGVSMSQLIRDALQKELNHASSNHQTDGA